MQCYFNCRNITCAMQMCRVENINDKECEVDTKQYAIVTILQLIVCEKLYLDLNFF